MSPSPPWCSTENRHFLDGNKHGRQEVTWEAISCPNPECREYGFG